MKNPLAFMRKSFEEMKHVVWPTPRESKRYLVVTVGIILVMTIYLSVMGFAFREIMHGVRKTLNPNAHITNVPATTPSGNLYQDFGLKNNEEKNTKTSETSPTSTTPIKNIPSEAKNTSEKDPLTNTGSR